MATRSPPPEGPTANLRPGSGQLAREPRDGRPGVGKANWGMRAKWAGLDGSRPGLGWGVMRWDGWGGGRGLTRACVVGGPASGAQGVPID